MRIWLFRRVVIVLSLRITEEEDCHIHLTWKASTREVQVGEVLSLQVQDVGADVLDDGSTMGVRYVRRLTVDNGVLGQLQSSDGPGDVGRDGVV